jgi:hypothetical protein
MLESQGRLESFRGEPELLQELSMDVSTEELLSAERAFTYDDLYAMVDTESKAVWLTPHAVVMPDLGIGIHPWTLMDGSCRSLFKIDGKALYVLALSPEALSEICDVVLRILAASVVHAVHLDNFCSYHRLLINAPTLAHLLEQCKSLKALVFEDLEIDENHCRVLGAYSRPGLEIVLISCSAASAGTSALAELLGRNQGPTSLTGCSMDYSVLADGLRENSCLKRLGLAPRFFWDRVDKRQLLAIASALRENKGLVELDLSRRLCDETWYAVCDSLKTHPTLEVLNLSSTDNDATTAPAIVTSRTQALLDMMKKNMSIHTIHLHDHYLYHVLFQQSVQPYLTTNRLRPRVRAIQKTSPITYRAGVLGRALVAARSDANGFWMLFSGNAEVTFPSRATAITVAANLVTSAIAAAITNDAAAITNSAELALANLATASIPTAIRTFSPSTDYALDSAGADSTPNAETPCSGQKRKGCPESCP